MGKFNTGPIEKIKKCHSDPSDIITAYSDK